MLKHPNTVLLAVRWQRCTTTFSQKFTSLLCAQSNCNCKPSIIWQYMNRGPQSCDHEPNLRDYPLDFGHLVHFHGAAIGLRLRVSFSTCEFKFRSGKAQPLISTPLPYHLHVTYTDEGAQICLAKNLLTTRYHCDSRPEPPARKRDHEILRSS